MVSLQKLIILSTKISYSITQLFGYVVVSVCKFGVFGSMFWCVFVALFSVNSVGKTEGFV